MGSRQIVLVSTAGFSVINTGSGGKLKLKGFFHSVGGKFIEDLQSQQIAIKKL
jgi:hypothetical protein